MYIVLYTVKHEPPGLCGIDWVDEKISREYEVFSSLDSAIECAKKNKGVVHEATKCWDYFEHLAMQREEAEKAEYQRLKQKYGEDL